jgi:hypothetical protein
MTGGIGLADVGLGLDDRAGGNPGARFVDENLADEILRDLERWARVKSARENHASTSASS